MKVLLVNGSPNREGCTYTALSEVAGALNGEGIETDFFWIGKKAVNGCIACRRCAETGKCIQDDLVNRFTDMAGEIDGFIFGSPVYYAGMNGALKAFMDRVFFSTYRADPNPFRFKPAAAVVSARRAGTSSALDQLTSTFSTSRCLWSLPGTGIWSTATRRRRCVRTPKACRPCGRWAATWRGCSG